MMAFYKMTTRQIGFKDAPALLKVPMMYLNEIGM